MMNRRGSGILLHITSLPSDYGVGDLGPWAYRFADFLSEAEQRFWQILPLNPTSVQLGNSPYNSFSAFAGNPLLISPDLLAEEGLLSKSDLKDHPSFPGDKVDYKAAAEYKGSLLRKAYENCKGKLKGDRDFERFCRENSSWLDDYALFLALREHFNGAPWCDWPRDLRDRSESSLRGCEEKLMDRVLMEKFFQHLFFRQWDLLKSYCNSRGIQIIGDIPIYVTYDSSDVWANPEMFKLNEERKPEFVAGVPPDYFSSTGQLWGNPIYRWDVLGRTRYFWWIRRVEHNLKLFDIARLDHFRGFVAYWEVRAGEETAANGRWVEAPASDFFNALLKRFPHLPVIAEDLGFITPDVREIMNTFGFPGMKVLIFAFGEDLPTNPYAPHNLTRNCVVYTGTHDTNTVRGWFEKEADPETRRRLFDYIGREVGQDQIHWELIRLAMMSVANMVVIPMQDILGLGEEARMNLPATSQQNWRWRLLPEQLTSSLKKRLLEMTRIYGRA